LEIEVTLRQPSPSETILAICAQTTGYNLRIAEIVGETNAMGATSPTPSASRHRIRIIQKPKFNLNLGISSQSAIPGEKCGDSYSFTKPNDGTYVLTLSDGMGNGNVAAQYSGATVELIERFLHAGLSKSSAINLVNSVLMLGKNTETFATIDISIINLFSGRMEFVKLGAGSSYIIRRRVGEIERISSTSLPAGILGVTDIETLSTTITSGDYIIMISDGVENAQNLWLANFLSNATIKNTQKLADEIIEKSKIMNESENADDKLALVIEII
jgi:stage II sporulation protein E